MSDTSTEANELKLINQESLAKMLGVVTRTVRRWVRKGKLPEPILRDGRMVYWSKRQVEAWQEGK